MKNKFKKFKTDSANTEIKNNPEIENFAIKIDASSIEKLPHGIRYPITITRTGILNYIYDGKLVREYRSPEEVFHPDSISTLRGAPITDGHPQERRVTPENYQKYVKGSLSDTLTINGDLVEGFMTVYDNQLNQKILSGKQQEISPGYDTSDLKESGEIDGSPYDVKQTQIRYNHVAVLERGRSGRRVRVKTDDGLHIDSYQENENNNKSQKEKLITMKIKGKEIKVDEVGELLIEQQLKEDADRIAELDNKVKLLTDSVTELKQKADKLDEAEASLVKAKCDIDTMKTKFDSEVSEQVSVSIKAKSYLKNDSDLSGLSMIEVKKLVVAAAYPNKDFSEKNDSFISALFETVEDMPETVREVKKDSGRDLFSRSSLTTKTAKNDNAETLLSAYKKRNDKATV